MKYYRGRSDIERLMDMVQMEPNSGCWLFTGHILHNGYGCFSINRKATRAHRSAFELFLGPIPKNMLVLHRCDIRSCCNPTHLFLGTPSDNMWDKVEKGRHHFQNRDACKNGHQYSAGDWVWDVTAKGARFRRCLGCGRDAWRRNGPRSEAKRKLARRRNKAARG